MNKLFTFVLALAASLSCLRAQPWALPTCPNPLPECNCVAKEDTHDTANFTTSILDVSVPQAGVCTGVGCAAARLCQFDVVIGWQETAPINNLMVCFTDSLGFLTCVDHQAAQGLLSVKLSEKCGTDTQAQFIDAGTNTVIGQIDARCCNCFGGV